MVHTGCEQTTMITEEKYYPKRLADDEIADKPNFGSTSVDDLSVEVEVRGDQEECAMVNDAIHAILRNVGQALNESENANVEVKTTTDDDTTEEDNE